MTQGFDNFGRSNFGDDWTAPMLSAFLVALARKRTAELGSRAQALLNAIAASDPAGSNHVRSALEELVREMTPWLKGEAAASANGEKTESPVDMVDPDRPDHVRYELDASTGPELSGILEDLLNADLHRARGVEPPTRLLFDGPPGCGKTQAATWLARELRKKLAVIMLSKLISKWVGETGSRFLAAVEEAREADAVLLVDELDAVGSHRTEGQHGAAVHAAQVIGAVNQILEDPKNRNILIIGATNLPDMIDPAVARRLQTRVKFGYPDAYTRQRIVAYHWRLAPVADGVQEEIISRTEGKSGDALVRACQAANRRAARRKGGKSPIEIGDVVVAIAGLTREVPLDKEPSRLVLPGAAR